MSVANGELLPDVLRIFDFFGEGHCIVLQRDAAAVGRCQQLIGSKPDLARTLTGNEQRRRVRPYARLGV